MASFSFGMFIDFSLLTGSSAKRGQVLLAIKIVHQIIQGVDLEFG